MEYIFSVKLIIHLYVKLTHTFIFYSFILEFMLNLF